MRSGQISLVLILLLITLVFLAGCTNLGTITGDCEDGFCPEEYIPQDNSADNTSINSELNDSTDSTNEPPQTITKKRLARQSSQANQCADLDPGNSYYVDPENICGTCNDNNPGTITQPWCTIARAFESDKQEHLLGGQTLYLRQGIHRFSGADPEDNFAFILGIDGSASNPTVIMGYPGDEIPSIYMSANISEGWAKCESAECAGDAIYYIDWVKELTKIYGRKFNIKDTTEKCYNVPMLVAIDGETPILLNEVFPKEDAENGGCHYLGTPAIPARNKLSEMITGDYYFENDSKSKDFGKLYVWLPDETSPDNSSIEIGLPTWFGIGGNWIDMNNLKFRYSSTRSTRLFEGAVNFNRNSSYCSMNGIDAQYLDEAVRNWSQYGVVRDSILSHNGYGGEGIRGNYSIMENNVIEANNWKRFSQGVGCGGTKIIPDMKDLTIRNNLFKDNQCSGLWLDALLGGHVIENNVFINNDFTNLFVEVTGVSPNGRPIEYAPYNKLILNQDELNDYSLDLRDSGFIRTEQSINPKNGSFSVFSNIKVDNFDLEKIVLGTMYRTSLGWNLGVTALGKVFVRLRGKDGVYEEHITNETITTDWHHIGFVKNSDGTLNIYIDGEEVYSQESTVEDIHTKNRLLIGSFLDYPYHPTPYQMTDLIIYLKSYLNGSIDDVTIHTSALSTTQIQALYNTIVPPDELEFYYNFNDGHIRDISGVYPKRSPVVIKNNVFTNEDNGENSEYSFNIYGTGSEDVLIYNNLFIRASANPNEGLDIRMHGDPREPGRPENLDIEHNIFLKSLVPVDVPNCVSILSDTQAFDLGCAGTTKPAGVTVNNNTYLQNTASVLFAQDRASMNLSAWQALGYSAESQFVSSIGVENDLDTTLDRIELVTAKETINNIRSILGLDTPLPLEDFGQKENLENCNADDDCKSEYCSQDETGNKLCHTQNEIECNANGLCEGTENYVNCNTDCVIPVVCNRNGTCDSGSGENADNCVDCPFELATNKNALCVYNNNMEISQKICNYYANKRPGVHLLGLDVPLTEFTDLHKPLSSENTIDPATITGELMPSIPGKIGNAFEFDGNRDYLHFKDDAMYSGGSDFTWVGWVQINGVASGGQLIFMPPGAASNGYSKGWRITTFYGRGGIIISGGDGTQYREYVSAINDTVPGTWYHVAFTRQKSSDKVTAYLNGVQVNTETREYISDTENPKHHYTIFGGKSGGTNYLNGALDDVRYYDRVLKEKEIEALFNKKDISTGLVGHWPFDEVYKTETRSYEDMNIAQFEKFVNTPVQNYVSAHPEITHVAIAKEIPTTVSTRSGSGYLMTNGVTSNDFTHEMKHFVRSDWDNLNFVASYLNGYTFEDITTMIDKAVAPISSYDELTWVMDRDSDAAIVNISDLDDIVIAAGVKYIHNGITYTASPRGMSMSYVDSRTKLRSSSGKLNTTVTP